MLRDEQWSKLRDILCQYGVYDKPNLRQTIEGILYRMRVGCPWRDLPLDFGKWNSVYKIFNSWSKKKLFMRLFKSLVVNPDMEYSFIDGSFVKAHQHSSGAASDTSEAIGKSTGGNNTKIHMITDSYGLPIDFTITAGNVNDSTAAPELIKKLNDSLYIVADKGYDDEKIRTQISSQGSFHVIPRKTNSVIGNSDIDWGIYKMRHLVENLFARIKHYRAVATRYDKLAMNYKSLVAFACAFLWLPM